MITVTFYGLLRPFNQFYDPVPLKLGRSGVEEVVKPVFEALFFVENKVPKMVRQLSSTPTAYM